MLVRRRGPVKTVHAIGAVVMMMVIMFLALPARAEAVKFPDVSSQDWFAEAADVLSDMGIVQGKLDGTLQPYETISRAEFVVLLSRSLGLTAPVAHPFADVPSGAWYEAAVSALYQAGLANGVTATSFDPDGKVSRQQAASFITRAVAWAAEQDQEPAPEEESQTPTPDGESQAPVTEQQPQEASQQNLSQAEVEAWLGGFPDRLFIAAVHRLGVADAYRLGLVSGQLDGRFYPVAEVTRAQTIGMLYAAFFKGTEPLVTPPAAVPTYPAYPDAGLGARGPHVLWLEQRLAQLTYRPGTVDGVFDDRTRYAVIAFQKWEGLARDGVVGAQTWVRLASASRPTASRSDSGIWIEVSLRKQVFLYIENGIVTRTLPTSTGRSFTYRSAPYTVLRKPIADGPRYRALYLVPGYVLAIHGYPSVPTYPASDGCVRLPLRDMDDLRAFDATNPMIPNGTRVYIG